MPSTNWLSVTLLIMYSAYRLKNVGERIHGALYFLTINLFLFKFIRIGALYSCTLHVRMFWHI